MGTFGYINSDGQIPITNLNLSPLQTGWVLDQALDWSAWISYSDNYGRNDQSPTFSGKSDNWSQIPIDFQGICMGGIIHLSVRGIMRDSVTGAKDNVSWDGHSSILGQNPSSLNVKNRLGDLKMQVIAYKESNPKWNQFGGDGLPIIAPDAGYGIMQLTPPGSTTQIWNWKDNVDAGKAIYYGGINTVQNHYNNLIATSPALMNLVTRDLQKAFYQYYNTGNKGFYWVPNSTNNGWIKNPNHNYTDYGDDAFNIESQITNQSIYPPAW